jgi:23S rRNA (adenine2503-C2)-methyltransferase
VTATASTQSPAKAAPSGRARSILDLTFVETEALLAEAGISPTHARALWHRLYRDLEVKPAPTADLEPPLRRWIADNEALFLPPPEQVVDTASSDGFTQKFLLRMADGQTVETVVMGYENRHTACLSTQAGCAMGCVFCATGQMGFVRHLRPSEIVAQVLHGQRALRARGESGLRNLVLMGMGEPLNNYDSVMTALDIISDNRGLGLGSSKLTISTVGVVPGIRRLIAEKRPYNLAVSVHGAAEEERAALVPISRRWPLAELIDACRDYSNLTGRRIFFEWTLIAGSNDSPQHAQRLADLIKGIHSHVNLIPLNPTAGFAGQTSAAAQGFQQVLSRAGIPSTVRQRRGIDVAAGCGQLRAERRERSVDGAPL